MYQSDKKELLEEIAIIGMSGRFPGARNVNEFWQNLKDGVESISRFSDEELRSEGISPETLSDPDYIKVGGSLEDVDQFDASFFGFSPREAEVMDPQHRVFMECAWEVLESAGYDSETYHGLIGVYAGTSLNTYLLNNILPNLNYKDEGVSFQTVVGNDKDHATARVSYKFNLKGPSVCVQTACSSSLVAVHLACQGLLSGDCDIALAGGASINIPVKSGYFYQEGGIYSSDGYCRAFDAEAKGTVGGNGAGIVALKRLEDALVDGDYIYAVIKGSAINNDGSQKVGYSAPSVEGQAEVIAMAQAMAGVEPDTITYVETHGTGTPLGDPIEIAALTQAFLVRTDKKDWCAIGSVKTNIGHLDAAAGVTGLIKTALAIKHRQLPPSLHFNKPNPEIDFANGPFHVNTELSEWNPGATPLRAGVSSFGMGGTNAHVVLEEIPTREVESDTRAFKLLVLSARTNVALENVTANLAAHLRRHPGLKLADIAYTLQVGRKSFKHRRMLVCRDFDDALAALDPLDPKRVISQLQESVERPVTFMFPGQGTQHVNMGLELYQTEPVFREHVDHCSALLVPHLECDLRDLLYPDSDQADEAMQKMAQTCFAQPAIFVIEYALARMWMAWGLQPQAMIGHSIGEYVAACLAGVFSLEDALALLAARGQLIQRLPEGAMLAVPLPTQEVESLLGEHLSLAAVNGPALSVVSGPTAAVDRLEAQLAEKGLAPRRLHTSHAFHSKMMDPILDSFAEKLGSIDLSPPKIPYLSNVSGTWITATEATNPSYWVQHLRQTVRFSTGVQALLETPNTILLEVGPGRTLESLVRRHPEKATDQIVLSSMRHPDHQSSDAAFLLDALGRLWLAGAPVDWLGFYAHELRGRLPLPTYPFERQRYWIEPQNQARGSTPRHRSPDKKPNIADWFYLPSWKRTAPPVLATDLADQRACWLVFSDPCGLGPQMVKRLEQEEQDVITVVAGERFAKLDERKYTINPRQRDGYDALFNELTALDKIPQKIVHLWSVSPNHTTPSGIELFEEMQCTGFYSLLFLAKAFGKHDLPGPFQYWIVSNNLYDVTGKEAVCPEKATLSAACKVLPQEYPNISCRSIDIELPKPGSLQEDLLINLLMKEFCIHSSDPVIAYRGPHRWLQHYEALQIKSGSGHSQYLRQRGVYLITGGLGKIGFILAEYLAQTVQAKLVLTGRSELPPRKEWSQWLAIHDQTDDLSHEIDTIRIRQTIQKVHELETFGAVVLVLQADVADVEQMQAVVSQAHRRFGMINGLIHAAGHTVKEDNSLIQDVDRWECEKHFRPKAGGLFVLDKVLHKDNTDFRILISSNVSVLGGLRSVAYTAANLFMDTFAQKQNTGGTTSWVSTNWDHWAFQDEEEPGQTTYGKDLARFDIHPGECVEAFQRILSLSDIPQVVISTGDLQPRIEQWLKLEPLQDDSQENNAGTSPLYSRPDLKSEYVAPGNSAEQILADIWAESLGIEQVGIHDNFFELGGDSVLSLQIISKSSKAGVRFNPKQIFEHQTISELARVASMSSIMIPDQGLVAGPVPLTPIQHWFFEQNFPDMHCFTLAYMLEIQNSLNIAQLEQVVQQLISYHDALRLRYSSEKLGWQQFTTHTSTDVSITRIDLSIMSEEAQVAATGSALSELQESLNLSEGPVMRIALFDMGSDKPSRLLWVIHHLLVDVVSWQILLEDLQTGLEQLSRSEPVQLSSRTISYRHWAEWLEEYAESEVIQDESNYWLSLPWTQITPLPVDHPEGINSTVSAHTVSVSLTETETRALLQDLPRAFNTQTNDVLLAALVQTFSQWTGAKSLLVDTEGHGRDGIVNDMDFSRTVGWFTTLYPMLLESGEYTDPVGFLKSIKEQLRNVPNQGIGYGLLQHLSNDLGIKEKIQNLPRAEVLFGYLGQLDPVLSESALFGQVHELDERKANPNQRRTHLLEISAFIRAGCLQLDWTYSENIYRRATIEDLSQNYLETLRALVAHCQTFKEKVYTPSDFPGAKISQQDLDRFTASIASSIDHSQNKDEGY